MTPDPDRQPRRAGHPVLGAWLLIGAVSITLAETPDPPVPLFDETAMEAEPISITIEGPWRRLRRSPEDAGPFPATLQIDGADQAIELTIEKRGRSRQEICRMPPIRLRFDEDRMAGTLFAGNRSIKMVTHCRDSRRYDEYVRLEFIAYRLYNVLTDLSFRVRPVDIIYRDSERNDTEGPKIAFLIEDDRLVGNRHGLDKLEVNEIRPADLPEFETSLLALFQYMIGNVDFSPLSSISDECCHNAKLIGEEGSLDPLFAVPYDFDSSGWVDAEYAVAPDILPIRNVRQRLFRGFCLHNDGLEPARAHIQSRREALYQIVESEPGLSTRTRRNALRYLNDFFEVLDDDRQFEREITGACRS